ncbi:hypothetical protein ARAM_000041 [Aspergillus rambellii]|uniref:GPI anchored cell wall protein n=1 Tax=Aspergillus rambellii TaxID=308745 RepID=A0A0F8VV25_9EURO|nr:hypothetical protein ARAM_000041 [Aspergillus rambellii]
MKTTSVSAALILGLSAVQAQNLAHITFIGAGDAQFTQDFPTDGSFIQISNPLSISHISSSTQGIACAFHGIDHSLTTVVGVAEVDVGPPQTQVEGSCTTESTPPSPPTQARPPGGQVLITFLGAANAQFSQVFPINGHLTQITNPLSISHIRSDTSGVTCSFNGIDSSVTSVNGAQIVDVGPPQTQVSGACRAA